MGEPRQPFVRVQRVGQMTDRGFNATEVLVLDWDHQWWMGTWEWQKIEVRRNLLLHPIGGSDSVSESTNAGGAATETSWSNPVGETVSTGEPEA